jgi:hypothetical protein
VPDVCYLIVTFRCVCCVAFTLCRIMDNLPVAMVEVMLCLVFKNAGCDIQMCLVSCAEPLAGSWTTCL